MLTFETFERNDSGMVASVNCLPEVLGMSSSVASSILVCLALARCISTNRPEKYPMSIFKIFLNKHTTFGGVIWRKIIFSGKTHQHLFLSYLFQYQYQAPQISDSEMKWGQCYHSVHICFHPLPSQSCSIEQVRSDVATAPNFHQAAERLLLGKKVNENVVEFNYYT